MADADNLPEEAPAADESTAPAQDPRPAKTKKLHWPGLDKLLPVRWRTRLGNAAKPVALLILVVVIGVLGGGVALAYSHFHNSKGVEHFNAVLAPFKVIGSSPEDDADSVSVNTTVKLTFSRPVNPDDIKGDFFVKPNIEGTFKQGDSDSEIIFTPKVPFKKGTAVRIMVHGEFPAKDGTKLGADYFLAFNTSTPDEGVLFQKQAYIDIVDPVPTGQAVTYTLNVGKDVDPKGKIELYKGSVDALLSSLVYHDKTSDGGYTYSEFLNGSVDTTGMTKLSSQAGLKTGQKFSVNQPGGVYLAVALSKGKPAGHVWVVFTNLGMIVKQDDKKAVITAQQLDNNKAATADVKIYNLKSTVQVMKSVAVTGLESVDLPFSPKLDIAVGTSGKDVAVTPVSILSSLADTRSTIDLSQQNTAFAVTDKPTYSTDQTIRFAGFNRLDNDAAYSLSGNSLKVYVASSQYDKHLRDLTVIPAAAGTFNGSFAAGTDMLNSTKLQRLHLFIDQGGDHSHDVDIASFNLTNQPKPQYSIDVHFDQSSYTPDQPVTATINGSGGNKAMANKTVKLALYSDTYYDDDPASNLESFGSAGYKVAGGEVKLDKNGQGAYNVDLSKLPAGESHQVTVQAVIKDSHGNKNAGGGSAVVHMGDAVLKFGPGRSVIQRGGQIVGRVYAKHLDGSALSNTKVSYDVVDPDNQKSYGSGSASTDGSGYAYLSHSTGGYKGSGPLTLLVSVKDNSNNKVQNSQSYYIQDPANAIVYSDYQLSNLDVSGTSGDVSAGDNLNLTVNSPKSLRVLMTVERGRIHKYKIIHLKPGNNQVSLSVSADLAPSFTLVFSYFDNGHYNVEGTSIDVNDNSKQAIIKMNASQSKAGQPTIVNLTTFDKQYTGHKSHLIVGAVQANAFSLYDKTAPDIYGYFYSPREITTNSSSSLTAIGSGGGGCGGGGFDQPEIANPLSSVAYWNPNLTTDSNGNRTLHMNLPKGDWRIYAYSMDGNNAVASYQTDLSTK